MAIQSINIGNQVNDGLGDDLRTAFQKVNANFSELNASLTITAINAAGTAGQGIFKEKVGNELSFRNLITGPGVTLEGFTDSIRIKLDNPDSFIRIDTDSGPVLASQYKNITFQGGENLTVSARDQVITFDTRLDINELLGAFDFGPIVDLYQNALQLSLAASNVDMGTIDNPGNFNFDLGTI